MARGNAVVCANHAARFYFDALSAVGFLVSIIDSPLMTLSISFLMRGGAQYTFIGGGNTSLARLRGELDLPNAVDAVELPGGDSRDAVLREVDGGQTLAVE